MMCREACNGHTETFCFGGGESIAQRQADRSLRKRKAKGFRLLTVPFLLLLAACLFVHTPIGWDIPLFRQTAAAEHGWNLILVNRDHAVSPDYEVELVTLRNGQQVDRRIYPDLQEMFDAMRADGIYPIVASGYRTEQKQRQLLNDKIGEYEEKGYSRWRARKKALAWVSRPGTSEHQLGIAVDINQEDSRSTARQVYGWLEKNAHLYGFICRYPGEKAAITGVSNEPWHYRYVGREAAGQIRKQGICLEEYLEEHYPE